MLYRHVYKFSNRYEKSLSKKDKVRSRAIAPHAFDEIPWIPEKDDNIVVNGDGDDGDNNDDDDDIPKGLMKQCGVQFFTENGFQVDPADVKYFDNIYQKLQCRYVQKPIGDFTSICMTAKTVAEQKACAGALFHP